MLILTIRTDTADAEIALYDDNDVLAHLMWQAHRELSATIHIQIEKLLTEAGKKLGDLNGVAVFKGPGSFTGLRIGMTVADTLSMGLNIPIVGETGEDWAKKCVGRLLSGENEKIALPEYGSAPHITAPKK